MKHLKWMTSSIVTIGIAVGVAGCGDKNAPSKENFAAALNENYSASADCLFDRALPFPYQVNLDDKLLQETRRRLDALTEAGLLTREQQAAGKTITNRYELTSAGKQVPGAGRFCYGRREVTRVDTFTPPTEFHGNRFTHVDYHFVEKDAAEWARDEAIRNAFPTVNKAMAPQPIDQATLVLTQDGWVLNSD
jgi:hypothetical protein